LEKGFKELMLIHLIKHTQHLTHIFWHEFMQVWLMIFGVTKSSQNNNWLISIIRLQMEGMLWLETIEAEPYRLVMSHLNPKSALIKTCGWFICFHTTNELHHRHTFSGGLGLDVWTTPRFNGKLSHQPKQAILTQQTDQSFLSTEPNRLRVKAPENDQYASYESRDTEVQIESSITAPLQHLCRVDHSGPQPKQKTIKTKKLFLVC